MDARTKLDDRIERGVWNYYHKGVITEAEAWDLLVVYWLS